MSKFIHLLYVPTMACNMQCSYCYLGRRTVEQYRDRNPLETLSFAVEKLKAANVIPFNISLHGGEVTTLPPDEFRMLAAYISEYYQLHRSLFDEFGFKSRFPHIKTNLYGLDRHIDAIRDYNISVSGSIDLPLSMHSRYRLDKAGGNTLPTVLRNVEMMRNLPNHKKVSATIFREHLDHIDEIVQDIRRLHENTCLDMEDFNFMFGFASPDAVGSLTALTKDEQVQFYRSIHAAFDGTDLQEGMDTKWFAEFTPDYCSVCTNCGDKFFLLERNGDIYSCPRGQGHSETFYGNIYENTVEEILDNARRRILALHRRAGFDELCGQCPYLYVCRTGCPFVKWVSSQPTSYTCLLQQELYKHMALPEAPPNYAFTYLAEMHPELAERFDNPPDRFPDGTPTLTGLIRSDPTLEKVYDSEAFVLQVDGHDFPLRSQLLKRQTERVVYVTGMTEANVYVRRDIMNALTDDPVYNALYIMLLSGNEVIYGDEQRSKQAHVVTHEVFQYTMVQMPSDREGFFKVPLTALLDVYIPMCGNLANLFITTTALREYHYAKQKKNGYYHAQAMNLPFQNMEITCIHLQKPISSERRS